MTKPIYNFRFCILTLFMILPQQALFAQEDSVLPTYKNQISTNLLLPIFSGVDLTYERTLGKKFAFGIASAIYGDRIEKLFVDDSFDELELKTNYEIMPLARIYFSGNQKKSHFVELFASISNVDETGRLLRSVNDQGFGVYEIGTENFTRGGLGGGYGYDKDEIYVAIDHNLTIEIRK